jgi:predicted membrane channel-forming protein YqfA (hemolysin III family)
MIAKDFPEGGRAMTAHTTYHGVHGTRARHASRLEYALYFVLILAISVPTAAIRSVMPNRSGHARRFFMAEAWAMAQRVTPQIFAA